MSDLQQDFQELARLLKEFLDRSAKILQSRKEEAYRDSLSVGVIRTLRRYQNTIGQLWQDSQVLSQKVLRGLDWEDREGLTKLLSLLYKGLVRTQEGLRGSEEYLPGHVIGYLGKAVDLTEQFLERLKPVILEEEPMENRAWEETLDKPEDRQAKYRHPTFKTDLILDSRNTEFWTIPEDILESKYISGAMLEKFSWNPVTGEFLFIFPGLHHSSAKMKSPFDDYLRGTILRTSRIVGFHPFYPRWLQESPHAQHDPEAAIFEVQGDAHQAMEEALRKHGAATWVLKFDVNNTDMGILSGKPLRRW